MSYSQLILPETPYGIWELSGNSPVDLTGRNNATQVGCTFGKKPIIYGLDASAVLDEDASITISNIYKLFLTGSEDKAATLEFFFNIPDSDEEEIQLVTIGTFARCYIKSDRIYLEANGTVCNVLTDTWDKTNYVAIIYKKGSVSIKLNNSLKRSISLPDNFLFPDAAAPSIVFGPVGNDIIVYINQIAIYSYAITDTQIETRINYSKFSGNADRVATAISAEIINPQYQRDMEIFSDKLSTKENFENGSFSNVVIEDDYLTLKKITPVSVSSMDSEIIYSMNMDGISFGGQSYIKLENISSVFLGVNNVILMSLLLDGLSTNQTILEYGPGVDYLSISLVKTSNNKLSIIKRNNLGVESVIIESADLGSDYTSYFNVALIFTIDSIELLINDVSQGEESISQILSPMTAYLGNSFSGLSPLTSKIKNFTIDNFNGEAATVIAELPYQNTYVDEYSDDIDITDQKIFGYGSIGLYTLSLQNTFNVSQRGVWSIRYPKILNSVGGTITYNYGSKNSVLVVNGREINTSSFIPNYDYENPDSISINAILKTDDSNSALPVLDNIFLVAYKTLDFLSPGGKYALTAPPDQDNNPFNNIQPYLLTDIASNPLDRPKNMGCKFVRKVAEVVDFNNNPEGASSLNTDEQITTGGRIVINSEQESDRIKTIEFLFKLESMPADHQQFTLFSINETNGAGLAIDDEGLIKTGTYQMYIDGVLTNNITNIDMNEFYYIAIVFPTSVSSDIYLGMDKQLQNGFNGSISNIVINNTEPADMLSYITYRYEAMKGRNTITLSDTDPISISDDSGTSKTYIVSSDGGTFAMNELPKIRIVQDNWESTD